MVLTATIFEVASKGVRWDDAERVRCRNGHTVSSKRELLRSLWSARDALPNGQPKASHSLQDQKEIESGALNRCFVPQPHEQVARTFAVWTFFIAVISGCFAVCTIDPISPDSSCVHAAAALLVAGFATTAVCDPDVVTSTTTLCTTRNRQFSLHLLRPRKPLRSFAVLGLASSAS